MTRSLAEWQLKWGMLAQFAPLLAETSGRPEDLLAMAESLEEAATELTALVADLPDDKAQRASQMAEEVGVAAKRLREKARQA